MRGAFAEELEQLRLQVELMALRVGTAVAQCVTVIQSGDRDLAAAMIASDDEIDHMHVSLLERCYELLVREGPVASDFRLVVSVIRALDSLERIGDLCLRIAKTVEDQPLVAAHPEIHGPTIEFARVIERRFDLVQEAWASGSTAPVTNRRAEGLTHLDPAERFAEVLLNRILELEGAGAVRAGMAAFVMCRSLDRIGDHTDVLAARLRYLLSGDPTHLADEVA